MKTKGCVTGGPGGLLSAFSGVTFRHAVLGEVYGKIFGVKNVFKRPAEYYVQNADSGDDVDDEVCGVEVRMTGISRNGRTPAVFYKALKELEDIVERTALNVEDMHFWKCQIFCVLMLDGEIELAPGSGCYGSVLEGKAFFAGKRKNKKKKKE